MTKKENIGEPHNFESYHHQWPGDFQDTDSTRKTEQTTWRCV